MSTRRSLVSLGLGTFAFSVGLFIGCGDSEGTGGAGPDISDVIFEGGTNDEALEALLAAPLKNEPDNQPAVTWPTDASEVPDSEAAWFGWQSGPGGASLPPAHDSRYGRSSAVPVRDSLALRKLIEPMFGGVASAHAHGDPVSGPAYFAVISTESSPALVRVFTTSLEYLPSEEVWAKIKADGGPVTVTVTAAEFDTNRIAQGGGPWESEPVTFSIVPAAE